MNYSATGSVRAEAEYNDNIRWSGTDSQSVSGHTLIPQLELDADGENTTINLSIDSWFRRFSESRYDSDDQDAKLSLQHKLERQQFGLLLEATRNSTLTSELLDSGRVEDAERHMQNVVQPSWSYLISEKNLVTIQGAYSVNKYRGSGFTNYDYWQASGRWTHSWNERLQLFLETNRSVYKSDQIPYLFFVVPFNAFAEQQYSTSSIDNSFQVGGQYSISEELTFSAQAGRTYDSTKYQIDDPFSFCQFPIIARYSQLCVLQNNKARLSLVNSSLDWLTERQHLKFGISRQTQPSSYGYTLQSTQYNLDWSYRLWEAGRISASITLGKNAVNASKDTFIAQQSDRTFQYALITYTQRLNDSWSLDCKYRYQHQKYDARDNTATSNAVYLGINYRPREWRWSR